MVRICIRMLRIPFDWFEFAFECLESFSNGLNLHSNPFRMVQICIRILFEFAIECFESLSNASNPFRLVRICIRMLRIPFERFKFAFKCFKSLSNGSNLHSNASNHNYAVLLLYTAIPPARAQEYRTLQLSRFDTRDAPRNKSSNPMNILHISEDGSAGIMEIAKYKNSAYCGRQTIDISNVDHLLSHLVDYVEKDRPVLFQRKERPSLLIHGKYTSKLN